MIKTKLFTHPALLLFRRPGPPEPSWMLSGWIELTCWARPGWRAICETTWDVECEMARGPKVVHRAVIRGPAIGDHLPVLDVVYLSLAPDTGQLMSLVEED